MPAVAHARDFQAFVSNLSAMPESVSRRWHSGECTAFAVALAEVVHQVFGVPKKSMQVYVGPRLGRNEVFEKPLA